MNSFHSLFPLSGPLESGRAAGPGQQPGRRPGPVHSPRGRAGPVRPPRGRAGPNHAHLWQVKHHHISRIVLSLSLSVSFSQIFSFFSTVSLSHIISLFLSFSTSVMFRYKRFFKSFRNGYKNFFLQVNINWMYGLVYSCI